jgi:hypothetical protein
LLSLHKTGPELCGHSDVVVNQVDDVTAFDLGARAAHAKQKDAVKEMKHMRVSAV